MGELFEVLGSLRFSPVDACPPDLKGKTVKLTSRDGAAFLIPAEAAAISGRVRHTLVHEGTEKEVPLPLKKDTVSRIVDYLKHHRIHPEYELVTPLASDDLLQCGVTRWDAKFLDCDKVQLFDLNLASSVLDMAGLFFLTSAKIAISFRNKDPDLVRRQFNLLNDLPRQEQERIRQELQASGKDAESEVTLLALTLQATAAAAEKHGCLEATRDASGAPVVDLRSWRHASWRATVLLDWKQLASAPPAIQADRDLLLGALMASQGRVLEHAAEELKGDRSLVLEAVKWSERALEWASTELRSDRGFVVEAIAIRPPALGGAIDALREDRSLLLEAAEAGRGTALAGAGPGLRKDQAFLLELLALDPHATKFVPRELLHDRAFALEAVTKSGRALQYLMPAFQADREIVAAAVGENVAAALFAHTSRRQDLRIELPWDRHQHGILEGGAKPGALQAPEGGGAGAGASAPRMAGPSEYWKYRHMKLRKSVQFSAFSSLTGNVGQANYVAANTYLDKLPAQQRPQLEAVTLMWGAVGHIGMRWKAFGAQDMLNATPEALLSVHDASMVLRATCCHLELPEWYATTLMDMTSREWFLTITAGGGTGGGYRPSETQGLKAEWTGHGLGRGFLLPRGDPLRESPLSAWPGLVDPSSSGGDAGNDQSRQGVSRRRAASKEGGRRVGGVGDGVGVGAGRTDGTGGIDTDASHVGIPQWEADLNGKRCDLEVGGRAQLVGLMSKNGMTGVLSKAFADGKWKVRLDDGSGNALLKACYLQGLETAAEVARNGTKDLPLLAEERVAKQKRRGATVRSGGVAVVE